MLRAALRQTFIYGIEHGRVLPTEYDRFQLLEFHVFHLFISVLIILDFSKLLEIFQSSHDFLDNED